ncbi:tryptophan--tRNA ligase [Pusillimonas sp. TS35]|uniref:tryptophan--tRNA ligase n=1 Tax=Paracandidimonas lactea TaxID=2895524 RepID=UPI00136AD360|nr:tryptophan--tRNA ligase [Paracandidimonas lactea]MYN13763.1 tryptophan--tRNA ligase [Pusillimonas sp. TS35]
MNTRVLTGITTSGTPHLGNYAGAIRPSIEASAQPGVDAFYFMADFHALIKCDDPQRIARSRLEIAATWLAAGLDPDKVTFYRQSDIPEIPELCWMLNCVTPKGLMNRAHAYKAAVDQNTARDIDPDDGVTMGLFSYPVLMAADILMFNANRVPVGRDQIQHLEMARDIAQRFNHLYGRGEDFFVLPEVQVDEEVATLPGLDGRKMSKSYDNTIPLFEGGAKALRTAVMRIVTDSRAPGEPKDAENSHLYTIYRAFATPAQSAQFRQQLEDGMGWGDAKNALLDHLEGILAPMRERYMALTAQPDRIEDILQAGAAKARKLSHPFMEQLREAVGLRAASKPAVAAAPTVGAKKGKLARFVSFRDEDGKFRFRLIAGDGQELLLSEAFDEPKAAGVAMAALKREPFDALAAEVQGGVAITVQGNVVAHVEATALPLVREAIAALQQD